jgi:hypothetical protein
VSVDAAPALFEPGEPEELPNGDVAPGVFALYELVWPEDANPGDVEPEHELIGWGLAFPDRAIVYDRRPYIGESGRLLHHMFGSHGSVHSAFLMHARSCDVTIFWPHGRPAFIEDIGDHLMRTYETAVTETPDTSD